MVRRTVVAAVVLATLVVIPSAACGGNVGFFVGFSEDLPKEIGADSVAPATALGARAFRLTLQWSPAQTALTSADAAKLDRATSSASGTRIVLAVYGTAADAAPTDAIRRDQYCGYVRTVLSRYPSIRDVVIWNEPNKSLFWRPQVNADGTPASPAAYEAVLAQCYDVLHAAFAGVNVLGLALSSNGNDDAGSRSPGDFIRRVGDAYRASGRGGRILDTVAYHPYPATASERPWRKHIGSKVIGEGDWNKLMYNLWVAFDGTSQPLPGGGAGLWYTEVGFQTTVAPEKAFIYSGTENTTTVPDWVGGEPESPAPAETTAAPDQGTQALDAIRLAACQPYVGAFFNFLLADEPILSGWQSGPLWADRTPKASYASFHDAIAAASSGRIDCAALKGGQPSADFMPPSAPASLSGTGANGPLRVELTWSASSDDASSIAYRIYRNGTWVGTSSTTSWTNVALTESTTYTYAVRALDAAGNLGDASAPATVTTPDATPPTAPTALAATAATNPGRVDLTWQPGADNVGVTGYEISRDGAVLATTVGTAFTDTSVASTTTYAYAVVALDAAGNRSESATTSVTTSDLAPPSAPGGLVATGADSPPRVALSWSAATDDVGVTAYEITRGGAVVATVTTTAWTDVAVAAGQTYAYAVQARDAAGNVGAEATATAKVPDATAPTMPTGLRASTLSKPPRVSLTWSASTDNVGVAGYRIFRNGVAIATTATRSYVDAAVARSTTYRYSVVAYDASGNTSGATASVSVKTPAK